MWKVESTNHFWRSSRQRSLWHLSGQKESQTITSNITFTSFKKKGNLRISAWFGNDRIFCIYLHCLVHLYNRFGRELQKEFRHATYLLEMEFSHSLGQFSHNDFYSYQLVLVTNQTRTKWLVSHFEMEYHSFLLYFKKKKKKKIAPLIQFGFALDSVQSIGTFVVSKMDETAKKKI